MHQKKSNISNLGAMGMGLAQMQCREQNTGTCHADQDICQGCKETFFGTIRRIMHEKNNFCHQFDQRVKNAVRSTFILSCSLLFFTGFIGGLIYDTMAGKLCLALIIWAIVRYKSRNKTKHFSVYGGMESPAAFSFGITLLLLGSMLLSPKMIYLKYAVPCLIVGLGFFTQGYFAGPHYGWREFYRRKLQN